jgi:superfamily II DNA/RNA helicase
MRNAIIFCNRKREVAVLHRSLVRHGFNAVALHGDLDQPARTAALDQFRRGDATILVASDVAARGLDIPDVSHVFNFDVPHHADDYVHRVGRTGRAGRSGTAITIVSPHDQKAVGAIEKLTGQDIVWQGEKVDATQSEHRDHRNGGQHRSRSGSRSRGGAPRHNERPKTPAERPHAKTERPRAAAVERPQATVAHIEEARSRHRPAPQSLEDTSAPHLPAFLLRPVRIKA